MKSGDDFVPLSLYDGAPDLADRGLVIGEIAIGCASQCDDDLGVYQSDLFL